MAVRPVDDKPSDTLVVVTAEGLWTGSSTLPHLHHPSSRARASRAGTVSFDHYDELHTEVAEPSHRTFGQLKAELGDRAPLVERLLMAFGLAAPEDAGRLPPR